MVKNDILFIQDLIESIVDTRIYESPSAYIERIRYMPKELTPRPGYYSFDYTPYLREPFEQLADDSGTENIYFMKSAQIGYTVGLLQNAVLYFIGSNPKRAMYVTADGKLAKKVVEKQIDPMIKHAGLEHLIYAQNKLKGSRSTGSTSIMKEFPGGDISFNGAKNPDTARGDSVPVLLFDEIDTFRSDKKEGSILSLFENRSNAFAQFRKKVYGSTPLIKQSSQIYRLYQEGDQRNFFIPCPRCGEMIVLHWHGNNDEVGRYGIVFDHIEGKPIYDSVAYKCQICGGLIKNHEKTLFMAPDVCKWQPTATAQKPRTVSYWLNALYSPVGMYSWENIVEDWVDCWDIELDRLKDKDKYREFRNTKQGLPFEEKGESINFVKAMLHRRTYASGTIKSETIKQDTGGEILAIICSVDVQKSNLFVDIKGYTKGGRTYTLEFFSIEGESESTGENSNNPWNILYDIIKDKRYTDENGKVYSINFTLIDSGKFTTSVYDFCSQFTFGVYPIKGERYIQNGLMFKMMSKDVLEKSGCSAAFRLNVTSFKDRIARFMSRLEWNTREYQPEWYPNFPQDLGDDYFKQFEAESRVDAYDKLTNKYKGSYWKQISGRDNHAFDTYVYNIAGLEIFADMICREELGLDVLEWSGFWEYMENVE